MIASTRYRGALYDPNAGHIHPLNYTLGLAAAAERPRRADLRGHPRPRFQRPCAGARAHPAAKCAAGNWSCAAMCTWAPPRRSCRRGSWPSAPASWRREPLGAGAGAGTHHQQCRRRRHELGAGLLPSFGGSPAAVRGRVTYAGFDPDRIAAATRARMTRVFPQLQGREGGVRLGRPRGHHAQPRAGLRAARVRMCTTCRDSPGTALRWPAWPASW